MKNTLTTKPWRLSLLASGLLLAFGATAAEPETTTAEEEKKDKSAERIQITGSRIKQADIESANPVIIITNEEMQRRGHVTVFDALKNLSQNSGLVVEGPEFTSGFTPDVQTLNLRNFGVGYTLTLVNGRRLSNYPAAYQSESTVFNFGAIPTAAVERVEVLTNGASAIYGSDAVAGVINIILRKDIDETTIALLYGNAQEANRSNSRVQLLTGDTWDSGNLTVALEFQDQEGIYAGDYSRYDSWYDYPYGEGFVDRANLLIGQIFPPTGYLPPTQEQCENAGNGSVLSYRPGSGYYCGIDFAGDRPFRNPREQMSGYVSLNQELTGDIELFADLFWYSSESSSRRSNLSVSEYIYDGAASLVLAQRLFTGAELGRDLDSKFNDDSMSVGVGLRGSFEGGHDWEFYLNSSKYELESERPWFKTEAVIDVFLGDYWGFWGSDGPWLGNGTWGLAENMYNPLPADIASQLVGDQTYGNETYSDMVQFVVNGDLFEIDGRPVGYAVVAEYEESGFKFRPDDRIQQDPPIEGLFSTGWWGLTGYYGDGDRERSAVGVEVSLPVLETVTVNVAARLDKYDNVTSRTGDRTTPQISVEWRPLDGLLVRGGYGESFRAPDLNYIYTNTGFFTSITDYQNCLAEYVANGGDPLTFDTAACGDWDQGIYAQRSGTANVEGAESLKDETGHNVHFGVVWDISEELNLSVDYFKQRLTDRVVTESLNDYLEWEYQCYGVEQGFWDYSRFDGLSAARCDYVDARVDRVVDPLDPDQTRLQTMSATPVNQSIYEAESIDVKSNYRTMVGPVALTLGIDYTRVLKNRDKSKAGEPWYDWLKSDWASQNLGSASLAAKWDEWSAQWTTIYRGSMTVRDPARAEALDLPSRTDAYIYHNLTLGYFLSDNTRIGLRVANVLNDHAPRDASHAATSHPWYNIYTYSGAGIGRQFFLDLEHTF